MAYTTIDDGSEYFHTQLYAGDGNDDRSITNDANAGNFKPDWLWIKNRSSTNGHALVDTTRGATKVIRSQASNAEETELSSTAHSGGVICGDISCWNDYMMSNVFTDIIEPNEIDVVVCDECGEDESTAYFTSDRQECDDCVGDE